MTDARADFPTFERLSLEDGFHYFTAETDEKLPGKAVLSIRHCKGGAVLWTAAVPLTDPEPAHDLNDDGPTTFDRIPVALLAPALALAQALERRDYAANERALLAEFPDADSLLARVPGQWTRNNAGECGTTELTGYSSYDQDNAGAGAVLTVLEQAIGPDAGHSALSTDLDDLDLSVTVRGSGVYLLLAWARVQARS